MRTLVLACAALLLYGCLTEIGSGDAPPAADEPLDPTPTPGAEDDAAAPPVTDAQASAEDATAPALADGGTDAAMPICPAGSKKACGSSANGQDTSTIFECGNKGAAKLESCVFGCVPDGAGARCFDIKPCCDHIKAANAASNNICHAAPGTVVCPPTRGGGYCDPNGDANYIDGDFNKGALHFQMFCM
jgi:hypothetical protein